MAERTGWSRDICNLSWRHSLYQRIAKTTSVLSLRLSLSRQLDRLNDLVCHAFVVKRLQALAWIPSYHLDISSMAIQVMTEQPKRAYIEIRQPNWSTSRAKSAGENALTRRIGVAINPSTVPYPWAPNSTRGTAPRTMVMTPCDAPSNRVKAARCHTSPRARNSTTSEAGTTAMAIRAMVIAFRLRPKNISTIRPAN